MDNICFQENTIAFSLRLADALLQLPEHFPQNKKAQEFAYEFVIKYPTLAKCIAKTMKALEI